MSAPSKRFKFTVSRTAIVNEVYEIEADSWEEAEGILYDGGYGIPLIQSSLIGTGTGPKTIGKKIAH